LTPEALSKFQAELRDGKRSESTIGSYLAHLRATLAWACDQGMILAVPKIRRPQRAKKAGRTSSKGRPITAEEFDRLLAKVPEALAQSRRSKRATDRATREHQGSAPRLTHRTRTDNVPIEINPAVVESWRYYLKGLWLSGLRLEESLLLDWTRGDRPRVDLTGRRPMLRIPAECEKGHRDRLLPITPDFAEFLLQTPPAERRGPVFLPLTLAGNRMAPAKAGKIVTLIGESARVLVHTDPRTGKVKYASAHDLRRSFGNRWAKRVMPAVLQRLMRHESIETTMAFYVALDADELAEDLYRDHEKRVRGENGTVFGTVAPSGPSASNAMNGGNTCRNGG
jgi:integrase